MTDKIWLKEYPSDIKKTLEYPDASAYEAILKTTAEKHPEKNATIFFGSKLTYGELHKQVLSFAGALSNLGVKKGDRVGLLMPNCPQYVIAYYGALRIGAIVAQFNPLYTEHELELLLNDSGAETIVTLDMEMMYPKVKNIRSKTSLKNVIVTSLSDYLPFPKNKLFKIVMRKELAEVGADDDVYFLKDLLAAGHTPPDVEIDPLEDLALLQYTGGTTGLPKGVMLTHRNITANAMQCLEWIPKKELEEYFIPGASGSGMAVIPFFHVFGMTTAMNTPIILGLPMIIMPRFDLDGLLKLITKYKPSIFCGVPTIYVAINSALRSEKARKKYDLTSLRICVSGAAPLPPEVKEEFERITGGSLVEGYGLSEASPITHANLLFGKSKQGIGVPYPGTDAKIVDSETGEEMPIGEPGEMAVSGPQVMKGYWNHPEETAQILKDGWLLTGDVAIMDEEGFFQIADRKKDLIISGGYNVYPREVEDVLYEHPSVNEAAVIGVKDELRGEVPKVFIILKEGCEASEDDIISFCKEKLAPYKVPKYVEFREELPKSMIGKILRKKLRDEEKGE